MAYTFALNALRRQLEIGGLPDREGLKQLHTQGFRRLVNVSGADVRDLYPAPLLRGFQVFQPEQGFRDIFSTYQAVSAYPSTYIALSTESERCAFLSAVHQLRKHLRGGAPVYAFCRCGVGRSPTVSMTALALHWRIAPGAAAELIVQIRPQARLSALSHAAAEWASLLPAPSQIHSPHAFIHGLSNRLDRAAASA